MKLKYYRALLGLTQESVAQRSGLSRPYINQLESGRSRVPSVYTGLKLAHALGCTVEELFEDEEPVKCPERSPVEILEWAIKELNKVKRKL